MLVVPITKAARERINTSEQYVVGCPTVVGIVYFDHGTATSQGYEMGESVLEEKEEARKGSAQAVKAVNAASKAGM